MTHVMHSANAGAIHKKMTAIAQAVMPTFAPDAFDWRPFFLDIWEGDGNMNFGKMLAHRDPKTCSVVIRSGQGHPTSGTRENFYKDLQYEPNVAKAIATEIPWQQYHVYLPNYKDTRGQVEWARQRMETVGEFPRALWWDHQLQNGMSPAIINGRLQEVIHWSRELIPEVIKQGIYSALWVFQKYAPFEVWMKVIDFWYARWYNTKECPGVSQIDLPQGMSLAQIVQQQTTSMGGGSLFGSVARRVDYNRAMMKLADYMRYLSVKTQQVTDDFESRLSEVERFKNHILAYGGE